MYGILGLYPGNSYRSPGEINNIKPQAEPALGALAEFLWLECRASLSEEEQR